APSPRSSATRSPAPCRPAACSAGSSSPTAPGRPTSCRPRSTAASGTYRAPRSPSRRTCRPRPGSASPRTRPVSSTRPWSGSAPPGARARRRVRRVRQILELLERDAQLSHETIATMTGLPVAEVSEAIAAWEASGAIRRYKAVVDWDAVDEDPTSERVTAFIDVSLTPARGVGFDDVAARIARFDEVRSVYLVSGTHDLRCTVIAPTIRAVSDFVSQKLS